MISEVKGEQKFAEKNINSITNLIINLNKRNNTTITSFSGRLTVYLKLKCEEQSRKRTSKSLTELKTLIYNLTMLSILVTDTVRISEESWFSLEEKGCSCSGVFIPLHNWRWNAVFSFSEMVINTSWLQHKWRKTVSTSEDSTSVLFFLQ